MSKKPVRYDGQLPLMNQVNAQEVNEQDVVPMEFNSKVELEFFEQALFEVVPKERRDDPKVKQSIDSIYVAHYGVVGATKVLAIAIYQFCELTNCKYEVVRAAMSKGTQKQLTSGYISDLYRAGKALTASPVASRITDINKLALVGRLNVDEIKSSLSEDSGQAKLGIKFIALMSRDQFKDQLSELHPARFDAPKPKAWNISTFRDQVDASITANPNDIELTNSLKSVLAMLDTRIKAIETEKLLSRERAKAEKASAKMNEIRASA